MANVSLRPLLGAGILLCPLAVFAQVGTLSDTLSPKMEKGEKSVKLSFRSFDQDEADLYGNLSFYFGFSDNFDLVLRASGAEITTVGATRTGGTDIELQAIMRKKNLYLAVGAAKPSTPSEDNVVLTWTAGFAGQDGGSSAFFGATGVTSDNVTLIAASIALRTPVCENLSFDASSMFMIRGENTANLAGNLESEPVFNFALRYVFNDRQTFWLSMGNSLGDTTGFSMSHKIQKGYGFGAGLQVKF